MAKKKTKAKPKIFISRKLDKKSPFHKLKKKGVKITDTSFLKFKELSFAKPPFHSAVFFYSARAIVAYLTKYRYDSNLMYGVMGPASGKVFKKITRKKADLIGTGNIKDLVQKINQRWTGYTVLFPKAKQSLDSLADHTLRIESYPINVYDNKINKKLKVPNCDILIFTSPLNFLGYLHRHSVKGKKIYAIGATTATVIKEVTGTMPSYPETPSIDKLYELVKEDLRNKKKKKS